VELVQDTFRSFVARQFGTAGRAWLDSLPKTVAAAASEWNLEVGRELHGGALACVREVWTSSGEEAILKVAGPWGRPRDEIAALRSWAGRSAPRLIHADPDRGALLLERIRPAMESADADAVEVAGVLRSLHVAPWRALRPLEDVARERVLQAVEQERATEAAGDAALDEIDHLTAGRRQPEAVLLHGDFDERNLLRCAARGLAAIDPLPAAGDPAYDAAYWAHANRRPGGPARADAIADALELDPERVHAWRAVIAVHG
jgi:streptomycin 6-kinase